jgi:hypothetical protein
MSAAAVLAQLRQQVDRWAETWLKANFSRLLELRAQNPGPFNYPIAVGLRQIRPGVPSPHRQMVHRRPCTDGGGLLSRDRGERDLLANDVTGEVGRITARRTLTAVAVPNGPASEIRDFGCAPSSPGSGVWISWAKRRICACPSAGAAEARAGPPRSNRGA